jgi:hypothetical protein
MQPDLEPVLPILDAQQRPLGQLCLERREGDLLIGKFIPGPAFPMAEPLFRAFEKAADIQALGVVDDLDASIAALGLQLVLPQSGQRVAIRDVQIWHDGGITCRLSEAGTVLGPCSIRGGPGC